MGVEGKREEEKVKREAGAKSRERFFLCFFPLSLDLDVAFPFSLSVSHLPPNATTTAYRQRQSRSNLSINAIFFYFTLL
jgi:hypothetical protein